MDIATIIENVNHALETVGEAQEYVREAEEYARNAEVEASTTADQNDHMEKAVRAIVLEAEDFMPDSEVYEDEDFDAEETIREVLAEAKAAVDDMMEAAADEICDVSEAGAEAEMYARNAQSSVGDAEDRLSTVHDILSDLRKSLAGDEDHETITEVFDKLKADNEKLKEQNETLREALAQMRRAHTHVAKRLELDAA